MPTREGLNVLLKYVPALVMVGFMLACEHVQITEADGGLQPTLSTIQTTIFTPKCAVTGCHVPGGIGPMALRSVVESAANLVNVSSVGDPALRRVEPNNPADSYLVRKLEGTAGSRMPLGGAALSADEIDLIKDWISAGAQQN